LDVDPPAVMGVSATATGWVQMALLAQPRHEVGIDKSKLPIFLQVADELTPVPLDLVEVPEGSRTPTAGHDHANDPRRPSL